MKKIASLLLSSVVLVPCFGSATLDLKKRIEKEGLFELVAERIGNVQVQQLAKKMLDDAYEVEPRSIDGKNKSKYGKAFSVNPEVLAHLMHHCQGKKVLEVGAARGENALLVGLAGAGQVYINDIEPLEFAVCRKRVEQLPAVFRKKFTLLEGDCLQVFADERYSEAFEVIYIRNVFHFYLGAKRQQFINFLKRLLLPGGQIILSVQSGNSFLRSKYPGSYVFRTRTPLFLEDGELTPILGMGEAFPETKIDNLDPLSYTFVTLMGLNGNQLVCDDFFRKLSVPYQRAVEKFAKKHFAKLPRPTGNIICHVGTLVCYTKQILAQVFEDEGFRCIGVASTGENGHIVENEDAAISLTMILEKK